MGCNCGKPKCDGHCNASPAVLQINNPSGCVLFHKVEISASMGNEITIPPEPGLYKNVLLYYEATGNAYFYSSDGIPTPISYTDYVRLMNKPSINGVTLVGNKSLSDLGININDAALTVKQGGTTLGTFSANASENVEINVGDIYEIVPIAGESDRYGVYKNGVLIEDPAEAYRAIFEDAAPQEIRWRENPGAVCYHKCLGTVLNFIGGTGSGSDECGYDARIYSLALNSDGTFSVSSGEIAFRTNLELDFLYRGESFLPNGTYTVRSENPVYGTSGTNYNMLNQYFMQRGESGNVALSVTYGQSGHRLVLGDIDFDTENGQTVFRMGLMNVSRQEIYSIIFRSDSTYTVTNRYKITTTDLMGA